MNFNQYECRGGMAVPVNPFRSPSTEEMRHDLKPSRNFFDFKTWLQSQPTIHCDPELSGVYPVGEFGEVVWQYFDHDLKIWIDANSYFTNKNANENPVFEKFSEYYRTTRQFIEYIGEIHININDFAISSEDLEKAFAYGYLANPENNPLDNKEMMCRYEIFKTEYLLPMLRRKHIID